MGDIQKRDPKAVRIIVATVGCGALLGAALIQLAGELRPGFEAWVKEDVNARVPIVIAVVMLLTVGPVLGMAGYMWRFGRQTVRGERYPPPWVRMVRDAPVLVGDAAIRRGRLVQALAAVIGIAAALLAFFLTRLFLL